MQRPSEPMMQIARTGSSRLDEVVLGVLAAKRTSEAPPPDDRLVTIEIELVDDGDAAETTQFVRFSAPYERVDLDLTPVIEPPERPRRRRASTYVRTVARQVETRRFELIELDAVFGEDLPEEEVPWRTDSWSWLAISLAAGAAFVAAMLLV